MYEAKSAWKPGNTLEAILTKSLRDRERLCKEYHGCSMYIFQQNGIANKGLIA